jgi:hypothetical protein
MNRELLKGFAPGSAGLGEISTRRGMPRIRMADGWAPLPIAGGAFGTISVLDSLAATNQSVVEIGESIVWAQVQAALAAHNAVTEELMADFVETTTDRRRRYGGNDEMTMEDIDEFGRPDAQKITAAADVDFPLRKYGASLQWTADSLEVMSGAQMAANVTAIMDADTRAFQREIKRAGFRSANYTAVDRLVDGTTLAVKRLVNADGAVIPLGPQGETFDGATHTHYLATASFIAANMDSLILAVVEHNASGTVRVYINRAQETAVRALAGFTAYLDARLVPGGGATAVSATTSLSSFDLNNREIGIYSAGGVSAVVTVKPWVPASYLLAWIDGGPRPFVRRIRNANRAALRLVADNEAHPLHARSYEREHGFGVWQRTAAAVLYVGGGTFTDPVLN